MPGYIWYCAGMQDSIKRPQYQSIKIKGTQYQINVKKKFENSDFDAQSVLC